MTEPVLRIDNLHKRFGGLIVTDGVTLDIAPGELHAVIGPNGAGKTTLINQISGLIEPNVGRMFLHGAEITRMPPHRRVALGIARSFQITSVLPSFSALENVALAAQSRAVSSYRFFRSAADEHALNEIATAALKDVGLATRADVLTAHLSHGEKRALELAMSLATEPKLLLLDEPLAGTGREEADRLIDILQRVKGRFSILLVEHDMDAVFALADRVSVLTYGRILASGTPESVRADPLVIAAYLGDELE